MCIFEVLNCTTSAPIRQTRNRSPYTSVICLVATDRDVSGNRSHWFRVCRCASRIIPLITGTFPGRLLQSARHLFALYRPRVQSWTNHGLGYCRQHQYRLALVNVRPVDGFAGRALTRQYCEYERLISLPIVVGSHSQSLHNVGCNLYATQWS
jgi:hypothetical protein